MSPILQILILIVKSLKHIKHNFHIRQRFKSKVLIYRIEARTKNIILFLEIVCLFIYRNVYLRLKFNNLL